MRYYLALIFSIFLMGSASASTESEFITEHIIAFTELNKVVLSFEKELLNISEKDTALKYIDNYSLILEKSLGTYSKYLQSNNSLIKEVSADLTKMLSDIVKNNYELLGKLIKPKYNNKRLKVECEELVKKNQYISNFFMDVSIGICMTTVKDRPIGSSENEQFSKLTQKERDDINELLIKKFGVGISKMKKESSSTSYEYSCVAIYEFLNMTWNFEK